MPLSFRLPSRKDPNAHLEQKDSLSDPASLNSVRASGESRSTTHALAVALGLGVAVSLCGFIVLARGFNRLPWTPAAAPADYSGLATSAFETALAEQLGTLEAQRSTQPPSPVPAQSATSTPPAQAAPPSNPWAADIPDAACIPYDLPQTGLVVEIVDGDTIKVLLDSDGRVHSVRYLGVDAPGIQGAGSSSVALEAMSRSTELAFHRQALLVRDLTDSDINGTLLRYVLVDGVFVNYALVSAGLARASAASPDTACLAALQSAEQQAQAAGLGLWESGGNKTPLPISP